MPEEGSVQVVSSFARLGSPVFTGEVIEMGARGEAVQLLAIHTVIDRVVHTGALSLYVGLSSNPGHLLTPPADEAAFLADKAIYGMGMIQITILSSIGTRAVIQSLVPLYGIIRPRRQILVRGSEGDGDEVEARTEIFYRPVSLGKTDLDTLNLKYGKYRRSG